MTRGVNSSSGGGSVPLPSQEVGSTAVNRCLVVAPPGCSKETKGLLARVISALMDIIRRIRAGLFFRSEEEITQIFSSEEITQILDQFNVVAQAGTRSRPEELEKLEELLQGLSGRGVCYILGEIAKKILDSAEGTDPERIKTKVGLFRGLCEEYHSKSSFKSFQRFVGECVMGRLEPRERLKIYTALRRGNATSINGLFINDFRWSFKACAQEKCVDGARFSNLLNSIPYNPEQAFCLLGDVAKHVLVDNNGFCDVTMEDNVDLFDELFKRAYEESHFKDSCSLQDCALWVLSQLEEEDQEVAIGVLREHGSVLVKGLV